VRPDRFGDPGAAGDSADDPRAAVPAQPPAIGGQEDGSLVYFTPDRTTALVMAGALNRIYFRNPHHAAALLDAGAVCWGESPWTSPPTGATPSCEFSAKLLWIAIRARRVEKMLTVGKAVRPALDVDERLPAVADAVRLRQAVDNLIGNAIRHAAPGSAVEVTGHACPDTDPVGIVIEVRDHGPGFPAGFCPMPSNGSAAPTPPAAAHTGERGWAWPSPPRSSAGTAARYSPAITPQEAPGCGSNCRAHRGLPPAAGNRRCETSQVPFTAITRPWMHAHQCQHRASSEREPA
jgi:hypothetical protein